jgi:hypothetical protein
MFPFQWRVHDINRTAKAPNFRRRSFFQQVRVVVATGPYTSYQTNFSAVEEWKLKQHVEAAVLFSVSTCVSANFDVIISPTELRFRNHTWVLTSILFILWHDGWKPEQSNKKRWSLLGNGMVNTFRHRPSYERLPTGLPGSRSTETRDNTRKRRRWCHNFRLLVTQLAYGKDQMTA